jgi:RHS repeat-associated protein
MSKSIKKEVFTILLLIVFATHLLGQEVQTVTLISVADALVKEDYPTQNFGSLSYFASAVQPKTMKIYRGLLKFDIPEELTKATIVSASLSLYAHTIQGSDITCQLKPAIMAWSENTVTWDEIPKTSVNGAVLVPLPNGGGPNFLLQIDNIVDMWINEGFENNGFVLEIVDETMDDAGMSFYSREWTIPDQRPKLTIKYYLPNDKPDSDDNEFNWTQQTVFDEDGNIISQSRHYFDEMAINIQNQSKVYKYCILSNPSGSNTKSTCADYISVVGSYIDRNQQLGLSTLPVPIFNNYFSFAPDLITDVDGDTYNYLDFENPSPDDSRIGNNCLLYKYYGTINQVDPYIDYCLWPFMRSEYSFTQPGALRHSCMAGEEHTYGGGHENQQYLVMGNYVELPNYNPNNLPFVFSTGFLTKSVTIDPDKKELIAFIDHLGRQIATCRGGSGSTNTNIINTPNTADEMWYDDPDGMFAAGTHSWYFDIHIPQGAPLYNTLVPDQNFTGEYYYRLIDLHNDEYVLDGNVSPNFTQSLIPIPRPGVYRLLISVPANLPSFNNPFHIQLINNYFDFSYTYYDLRGNVIRSTPPEGLNSLSLDLNTSYNSRGLPINTNSPDQGASQFVYQRDGSIRLSRNQQQVIENKFSYTNYDKYGRAIESGVSSEASIITNFNNLTDGDAIILNPIYCTEKSYTKYDFPDNTLLSISGIPSSYLNQTNLVGAVSSTSSEFKPNEYVTTYYSYNIDGQVEWVVRSYPVIGPKTMRYEYDELGLLAFDLYQEGSSNEEIKHIFTYNPDGSIKKTETLRSDEEEPLLQSLYKYYCNGSLKRLEIGHGRFSTPLQGIDYIYNCNGLLKAINSPEMATSLHPMPDDPVGRDYNDVFGMSIDYYQNDYKKYNPFISTDPFASNDFYDGKIATIRWKLQTELPYISINDHPYSWFNAYNYNSRNWFEGSDFKKVLFVNPYGAISYVVNSHEDFKLFGITYDANGNIKTLKRNGTSTVNLAMDDLIYRYEYGNSAQPSQGIVSNRLYHVNDAVSANSYPGALTDQGTFSSTNVASTNNYRYDAIGRLIRDVQSHRSFQYNAYGLLSQMLDDDQGVVATYNYDDNGKRFYKISRQRDVYRHTWYVNDVNGNLLAVYEATSSSPSTSGITPELTELPVYGATRIGQIRPLSYSTLYELTDHQGSLRALVKRSKYQTVGLAAYKDYYPFGQLMPGRNYQNTDYRYGYQGQFAETDPETGFTHFDAREFDTRLGRWMIPDPAGQYFSPYLGMGNNPVSRIDPDGMWDGWWKRKGAPISEAEYYPLDDFAAADVNLEYVGDENYTFGTAELDGPVISAGISQSAASAARLGIYSGQRAFWEFPLVQGSTFILTGLIGGEIISGLNYSYKAFQTYRYSGLAAKTTEVAAKTGTTAVQYTKSSLQLGQQMHKAYKVGEQGIKEFVLPSGRRIDFLDINKGIIYELKPFNPRAMQAGQKQLQMYMQELQTMPRFQGINWQTILDVY